MLHQKLAAVSVACAASVIVAPSVASAGSEAGNFMVRVLGTVVAPDSEATVSNSSGVIAGADAEASTETIPTLTLTYFLNKNVALELLCCVAKHEVDGKGTIANLGEVADTWIFPPAITLQYHFDGMGALKPYAGVGFQYIAAFSEGTGDNALGASSVEVDSSIGFSLQAGLDISIGGGWYLNADVRKTWIEHDVKWVGTGVTADLDLDPWIYSLGVGYRFNLEDLLGRRGNPVAMK
jgi:outer membrane protein